MKILILGRGIYQHGKELDWFLRLIPKIEKISNGTIKFIGVYNTAEFKNIKYKNIKLYGGNLRKFKLLKTKFVITRYLFWFFNIFRTFVREKEIDFIQCRNVFPMGLFGIIFGKVFNKKVIIIASGGGFDFYRKGKIRYGDMTDWKLKYLINFIARHGDYFIVTSLLQKKFALEAGTKREKIEIIPSYSTSLNEFLNVNPNIEFQDKIILLNAARLAHPKGQSYLIQALPYIKSDVELIFCGKGEKLYELKILAIKLGLQNKVKFTGEIMHKDLIKYYKRANIYCQPSLTDAFCNSVLEALACGLPVVCSRNIGVIYYFKDRENVIYIHEPQDYHKIAEHINYIIHNKNQIKKISNKAKKLGNEFKMIQNKIPKLYYNYYKKIIKNKK